MLQNYAGFYSSVVTWGLEWVRCSYRLFSDRPSPQAPPLVDVFKYSLPCLVMFGACTQSRTRWSASLPKDKDSAWTSPLAAQTAVHADTRRRKPLIAWTPFRHFARGCHQSKPSIPNVSLKMIHLVELLPVVHLYLSRARQYYWSHSYLIMAVADGPGVARGFPISGNVCWLCERAAVWSNRATLHHKFDMRPAISGKLWSDPLTDLSGPDCTVQRRPRDEGALQMKSRMEYCFYSARVMACEIMTVLLTIWVSLSVWFRFFHTQN